MSITYKCASCGVQNEEVAPTTLVGCIHSHLCEDCAYRHSLSFCDKCKMYTELAYDDVESCKDCYMNQADLIGDMAKDGG